jgi:hypothetical protein
MLRIVKIAEGIDDSWAPIPYPAEIIDPGYGFVGLLSVKRRSLIVASRWPPRLLIKLKPEARM